VTACGRGTARGGSACGGGSVRTGGAARWQDLEAGGVTLVLPMLLWVATLVAIVAVDIAAYLVAASRAQSLADAAALAAVSADAPGYHGRGPIAEADRVVQAGGGWLEVCTCTPGTPRASVSVSVPVPGLVIPTLGASRVSADAQAVLVPPGR
jgi:hypothetical protein